ncbi:hypothetical protein V6N11_021838 [Hibiscus sabdariffa]|uniref:Uncharacterized protein n=1 Tax=Hibiscus sabdariffa TaxID=183260 RepID=A0ABR2THE7_9ROSI
MRVKTQSSIAEDTSVYNSMPSSRGIKFPELQILQQPEGNPTKPELKRLLKPTKATLRRISLLADDHRSDLKGAKTMTLHREEAPRSTDFELCSEDRRT